MVKITISSNSINVRELIVDYGTKIFCETSDILYEESELFLKEMSKYTRVVVNGDIVGYHEEPDKLYKSLKMAKQQGLINIYSSVIWNVLENMILVCTEGGRCIRPLYVVENLQKLPEMLKTNLEWNDMIKEGLIEYLDVEEANHAMIALEYKNLYKDAKGHTLPVKYTHLEIHPSMMLGCLAASIPLCDHNQSPRNCFPAEDHEILTIHGFLGLDEILKYTEDGAYLKVACHVDGHLEYHDIGRDRVVYQDDAGQPLTATEFVSFKSEKANISILATPNHHMYGRLGNANVNVNTDTSNINYNWTGDEPEYKTYHAHEIMKFAESKADTVFQLKCNFDKGINSLNDRKITFIKDLDCPIQIYTFVRHYGFWLNDQNAKCECEDWSNYFREQCKRESFMPWVYELLYPIELQTLLSILSHDLYNTITTPNMAFSKEIEQVCILAGYSVITQFEDNKYTIIYSNSDIVTPYLKIGEQVTTVKSDVPKQIFCVTVPTESHLIMVRQRSEDVVSRPVIVSNTYQSAQVKQAIGVYATNYNERYDTVAHNLDYVQKPIVRTKMSSILNGDTMPNGINAIVAIACYSGYNQEDSVMINQDAVDLGLFTSFHIKTYKEQNNKNHSNGEEERFTKPQVLNKQQNYEKLEECGFVPVNTHVKSGDVIIGKVMPQKNGTIKDNSVYIKDNEHGFIDRNCYNDNYFNTTNADGYRFAKTRVRGIRKPMIGDKFANRYAQKGTCGILYKRQDMPYTKDGITPDIVMNPNAIPSRMTVGQLYECVMGKAACFAGTYGDATPFNDIEIEDVASVLEKFGMEKYANEILYNSRTGEQIKTDIFIGPTYYQRLKHMSSDKIHARGQGGPIMSLCRQPSEGRCRSGGLRLGEMEMECLWAHGTIQFLKERVMECSDNYKVYTCKVCGFMATVNPEKNIYMCRNCKNNINFTEIRIPYASKLLFQEIASMGIATRFLTD